MGTTVRALMIGDVVGEPGLSALDKGLRPLAASLSADIVVANGENAAGGFGLTAETLARLLAAGVDVVTSGNHVWEKREFWPTLDAEARVLRPANYPAGAPGRGVFSLDRGGVVWTVANLQGREDMTPIDCPFAAADALLSAAPADSVILVDFHAESTQEKEALAWYLDGRIGALVGTHTHVQTADDRLLPAGSAYFTDIGMTGVRDGIIGMDAKICMERNRTQVPFRMELAAGRTAIQGVLISFDAASRRPTAISRINIAVE